MNPQTLRPDSAFRSAFSVRLQACLAAGAVALALCLLPLRSVAAPLAGSTIGNQATATYTDSNNTPLVATSNVALTIVQQVAQLTLDASQSKPGSPGAQVVFPHTITNTGNGVDAFALSVVQSGADDFDLGGLVIYADANGDGLPDNTTPITSTGPIAAGSTFNFVVVGTVSGAQTSLQEASVDVTATSTFNGAVAATNTDTVVVSENAVVTTSLALDTATSASPGGPHTYTLTFTNIGNVAASDVTLVNLIPAGLTYVPGSARWSTSGGTALDDDAGVGDDPVGIVYDFGDTAANTATAIIGTLVPGQSGTLSFQVTVNANLPAGSIPHSATFTYDDGASDVGPFDTNTVVLTIIQDADVSVTGDTVASAPQGAAVNFTNIVTNEGDGTETYELTLSGSTFPPGTTFVLVRDDGFTTILDSNGNGIPDTGPLPAGESLNVVIKAILPPDATGGPFVVTLTATAASDPAISDSAVNELTLILANLVDLTVDGVIGDGQGPEGASVNTIAGAPGAATRFNLTVQNDSAVADNYDLAVSALADFSALGLPPGWTVVFRNASEAVVTSTGVIPAGGSLALFADVTPPTGQPPLTQDIYFRVLSPSTNSGDILFNALDVVAVRSLSLVANATGQASPGGTVDYVHTITNNGTALESDGILSTTTLGFVNSLPGWNTLVYYDANANGAVDGGETQVTDLSFVSDGAAGLAPGESVQLLVRVFVPAGAPVGAVNTTTLTATTANGSLATPVPPVVAVSDVTTVVLSDVRIEKRQALDIANDGTADGAFVTTTITTGAEPGVGIRYEITVTNLGTDTAFDVVVYDVTPSFTVYTATGPAATSVGSVTTVPADGVAGPLVFTIGDLTPGASAVITFGVTINP